MSNHLWQRHDVYTVNRRRKHYLWGDADRKHGVSFVNAASQQFYSRLQRRHLGTVAAEDATSSVGQVGAPWSLDASCRADKSKRIKPVAKASATGAASMTHNVYCVKNTTQRYIWGPDAPEEPLLDRVCAGAAFVACLVVLMFLG